MKDGDEYIGDGVYVTVENGMIKLYTHDGRGETNTIFLEPEVYTALVKWHTRLVEPTGSATK